MYEKLLPSFGYVLINNVYIVVSHIGETYAEDERSQARLGGYDPSTYQWVGICFYIYMYMCIAFFPENVFKEFYSLNCHGACLLF